MSQLKSKEKYKRDSKTIVDYKEMQRKTKYNYALKTMRQE